LLALKERIAAQRSPASPPAATGAAPASVAPAAAPAASAAPASAATATNTGMAAASPGANTAAPNSATPANGELLLNALPWANVESVLDEHQQAVKLPADVSTPFLLQLPAGKYTVTFRNPQSAKPAQVVITVDAGKRAQAVTTFATTSTQGYLTRAGW